MIPMHSAVGGGRRAAGGGRRAEPKRPTGEDVEHVPGGDETCPLSTGRGTRRVQLVREGRGGARSCPPETPPTTAGCVPAAPCDSARPRVMCNPRLGEATPRRAAAQSALAVDAAQLRARRPGGGWDNARTACSTRAGAASASQSAACGSRPWSRPGTARPSLRGTGCRVLSARRRLARACSG